MINLVEVWSQILSGRPQIRGLTFIMFLTPYIQILSWFVEAPIFPRHEILEGLHRLRLNSRRTPGRRVFFLPWSHSGIYEIVQIQLNTSIGGLRRCHAWLPTVIFALSTGCLPIVETGDSLHGFSFNLVFIPIPVCPLGLNSFHFRKCGFYWPIELGFFRVDRQKRFLGCGQQRERNRSWNFYVGCSS